MWLALVLDCERVSAPGIAPRRCVSSSPSQGTVAERVTRLPPLWQPGGDIEDLYAGTEEDPLDEAAPDPAGIIMCPFHNYDWNLRDGSSSTGMKACTFRLEVRDGDELWLEPPGDPGDDYRVVGVRAVSERESPAAGAAGLPVEFAY